MEILLAGNTRYVTGQWLQSAFPSSHVVVLGCERLRTDRAGGVLSIPQRLNAENVQDIFASYMFDCVVWFSSLLTPGEESFEEMELLNTLLGCCGTQTKVLYLEGPAIARQGRSSVLRELCALVCAHSKVPVQRLLLPWLYDASVPGDLLNRAFAALSRQEPFEWPVAASCPVSFLSMDDLAALLYRLFEDWQPVSETIAVPDCFGLTMGQIAEQAAALWPDVPRATYAAYTVEPLPMPEQEQVLRQRYHWFPRYSIMNDLADQLAAWRGGRGEKASARFNLRGWMRQHPFAVRLIELICGALFAELLTWASGAQVQFKMIDFRLLYIVLMGTIYGMHWGISAAGVESLFVIRAYVMQNINWLTLFYEPTNWIVFIAYFTVGAVCGYVRGKARDDLRFATQENQMIRQKFSFLRGLYQDTTNRNQVLQRQIVTSQDSFGKIFRVTQELDVTEPKEVFLKAIGVLEELMDNQSFAIYSIGNNKHFARLEASSRSIAQTVARSLRMDDMKAVLPTLEKGEVWVNRDFLPDHPIYLAAARENGAPVLLIEILQASYEQMSLYYQNLFKVLCGLIQASLLRALHVQRIQRAEQCVPGSSNILRPEIFQAELRIAQSMQEKNVSCYQLIELENDGRTLEEMEYALSGNVRENDVIGLGEDGNIRLLLSQISSENLPFVLRRLEKNGFRPRVEEG